MEHSVLCTNDGSFGPVVIGCRGNFDFTVAFESTILSIVPSAIFIALAIARSIHLALNNRVVRHGALQYVKSSIILTHAALSLALLVIVATGQTSVSRHLSLAAVILDFFAVLSMLPLSILEHERCRRPSTILTIYLILAILFDATKARTAWLAWQQTSPRGSLAYPAILVSIGVFKFLILVAESVEKFRWLLPQDGLKYEASHEETGGLLNLGVFFWLNSLFMRGYSNIMHVDQLYPLDRAMSSRHLHDSLSAQRAKSHVHIRYSLAKSLAGSLLLPIAPRIAYIGFTFAQPFFIATLISHLQRTPEPGSTSWYDQGKGLVGATILIYLGAALSRSLYNYLVHRTVYMARGALASAIYEKTTISPDSADVGGGGLAALTLMSTDVERIILGFITIHEVWANPVEVALGCWMLYEKLGLAFFSPLVTIVLCLAAMAWVAKRAAIEQTAWMGRIQARVGLTALAISDLKRLKIAGLDGTIAERIKNLRVEDLHYGSRFRFVQAMTAAISFVPQCIAPIFAFVFGARGLGVEEMFSALSFLVLVTTPLTMFFQSIPLLQSGMACLDRIDKFLVADSRRDHRTCIISCSEQCRGYSIPGSELAETQPDPNSYQMASLSPKPSHSSQPRHTGHSLVSIKDGSFGWTLDKMALKNINLEVRPGQFVVCVGPVASGKSTLCKAIIGEMPFVNGGIEIHPVLSAIAFCDQTPVILAGTIRDNIVRNTPFDSQRYDDVLHATALDQDISLLEAGDGTLLDSGGATLSGGQRNRLALARALYQHTQLLVVDDALSGLDSTTDSLVFQRCFGPQGLLRRRGVAMVFCTHSSRHVGCADHIAVLDDQGRIATQGSLDEVRRLDDYISSYDTEQAEPEEPRGGDTGHSAAAPVPPATSVKAAATSAEDHSRQTGEFQTYKYYLGTIGAPSLALFVLFNIAFAFGLNFSTVWISFWSSDTFHRGFSFYMGMYAFMRILQLAGITAGATIVLVAMVRVSGLQLHQATLKTVMQVPLAVQSAMNVGKVTNYFSQDMTILDVELPISFLNLGAGIFGLFAAAVVIATASPWLVISYPALFGLIWLIQMFYLRTSRQLRLLDLEAKSPLYAHFLDTIKGVATIRAYGWTKTEVDNNYALLDTSQRPAYLLAMAQQWLALTLDIVVAILAIMVTVMAIKLRGNSGLAGASLVTLMTFGKNMAAIVRSYTEVETSIGAVSRLKSFNTVTPQERNTGQEFEPEQSWPRRGEVDMIDVSATYSDDTNQPALVLNKISLSIAAGQKVAVCGRTGSGKSSLILLLLRLLDPVDTTRSRGESARPWKFTIDGVSIGDVDRTTLRQRLIAVPQECVFLPEGSSIKENVDLSGTFSDAECLAVLDKVQLSSFVEERGGLDATMSASQMSAGQKQLLSMGRAILRKQARERHLGIGRGSRTSAGAAVDGGILLLDEVSSSVDDATDRRMHDLIREQFASYTVIMVAHRLDSLVDYVDSVVVLDKGRVVETGPPKELLTRDDGWFRRLVKP